MKSPIAKDVFNKWETANNEAEHYKEIMVERIDYILKTIYETFDNLFDWWYFYGAGEGDIGELTIDDETVDFIVEWSRSSRHKDTNMTILLQDGFKWDFESSFPSRWLFENFEQELINGKQSFEEKEKTKKAKRKAASEAKKKEQQELVNQVKKKLSKKELAALKGIL